MFSPGLNNELWDEYFVSFGDGNTEQSEEHMQTNIVCAKANVDYWGCTDLKAKWCFGAHRGSQVTPVSHSSKQISLFHSRVHLATLCSCNRNLGKDGIKGCRQTLRDH